jgi:hypothetical protein
MAVFLMTQRPFRRLNISRLLESKYNVLMFRANRFQVKEHFYGVTEAEGERNYYLSKRLKLYGQKVGMMDFNPNVHYRVFWILLLNPILRPLNSHPRSIPCFNSLC